MNNYMTYQYIDWVSQRIWTIRVRQNNSNLPTSELWSYRYEVVNERSTEFFYNLHRVDQPMHRSRSSYVDRRDFDVVASLDLFRSTVMLSQAWESFIFWILVHFIITVITLPQKYWGRVVNYWLSLLYCCLL